VEGEVAFNHLPLIMDNEGAIEAFEKIVTKCTEHLKNEAT